MYGFLLTKNISRLKQVNALINGWGIEVADNLPTTKLIDQSGVEVGLVIGWAVCPKRKRLLSDTEVIHPGGAEEVFRREIWPLSGQYLVFLSSGDDHRIYMDGLGSLSVVYDPEQAVAAGTAADFMGFDEYQSRFDDKLYQSLEIKKEGWFPASLTAHKGLERLMPNHFLDCSRWKQIRHNHYDSALDTSLEIDEKIYNIHQEIQETIVGIINSGNRVSIGLTGGGDSRMLMAALKNFIDQVEFYTVNPPGIAQSSFDKIRAGELASRFGLRHKHLPYIEATDDEKQEWDRRVGHCVITANRSQYPSVHPLKSDICVGGLGGEVGRTFLWPNLDALPPINATGIVDALKLPRVPQLIERVDRWLENLPVESPTHVLDLAYIELRMSSWSNVQSYANPNSVIIHPLGSYRAIEAMLSLPPEYRKNDGMVIEFIRRYWPEILMLPINRYGDFRDFTKPLTKIFSPQKVYRRARKFIRLGRR